MILKKAVFNKDGLFLNLEMEGMWVFEKMFHKLNGRAYQPPSILIETRKAITTASVLQKNGLPEPDREIIFCLLQHYKNIKTGSFHVEPVSVTIRYFFLIFFRNALP
jgi:hypothetical protein